MNAEKTVTVVWNLHGGGKLIGVFDDEKIISEIKQKVSNNNESHYIKFYKVRLNEMLSDLIVV